MSRFIITFLLIIFAASAISAIDFTRGIMFDYPQDQLEEKFGKLPPSTLTAADSSEIMSFRFDADTLKVLAILVDWIDRPHTYSAETMDSLMFSDHVFPGGSVADYINEISYGKVTVVGDVYGWHTDGYATGGYDFESLLETLDPFIDYSQYDGDNDGVVDAVVFIRSGVGLEFSHACDEFTGTDIWSHAYVYQLGSGPGPFDGMYVSRWNTSPETYPTRTWFDPTSCDGQEAISGIRVHSHELMHNLGLPDLYDYDDKLVQSTYYTPNDDNDHPLMDWCVMGYGGYGLFSLGGEGRGPSHICGWSRKQLGWNTPILLDGTYNDLVLYDIESHEDSSLYMIPIDPANGEYFLLEYRNPHSTAQFDKLDADYSCYFSPELAYGSDSLDIGLLITHIDDSVGSWANYGTPYYDNYQVKVVDAGYNPGIGISANPGGVLSDSAQWWYPNETRLGAAWSPDVAGQSEFSPTSVPSSDGYTGPSGVVVRVDSIVGDKLYLYVHAPVNTDTDNDGVDDFTDNCINTPNPLQINSDSDSFGDACDNCPNLASEDQTDSDNDGLGDLCDNCPGFVSSDPTDTDGDGIGDVCDDCPTDPGNDLDGDLLCFAVDNCPDDYNPLQEDATNDGIGDACCCVIRGDINHDGQVNISDLTYLVDYNFRFGPLIICPEEANVDATGELNISDLTYFVDFLFRSGPPISPCN